MQSCGSGEKVNLHTGRLSINESSGTGWKLDRKETKNKTKSKREQQQVANSLQKQNVVKSQLDLQINSILPPKLARININSIIIGEREIEVTGEMTDVSFDFADIGSTRHYSNGTRITGATNQINPINQQSKLNLRAISRYLITNPEARLNFQYPTIPKSEHPNVQNDMMSLYDMSFSQISDYLKQQGVDNLNSRVIRSSGKGFRVFVVDHN